jgi:hypothetical protein
MYRVPHLRRGIILRSVEVLLLIILLIPATLINIRAIWHWHRLMIFAEYQQLRPVRYDTQNLLMVSIPIAGIICAFLLAYAVLQRWQAWKIALLATIVVITALAYVWYDQTMLTVF